MAVMRIKLVNICKVLRVVLFNEERWSPAAWHQLLRNAPGHTLALWNQDLTGAQECVSTSSPEDPDAA